MPETITSTVQLRVGTGFINASSSESLTQDGSENYGGTQSIPTSWTAVNLGAVSTIGQVAIVNTDATNYVEVDLANDGTKWPQKILAGGKVLLCPQSATIYARANTAAVVIEVAAVEL